MKATLITLRPPAEVWTVTDGEDVIRIWINEYGIHIQRFHKNTVGQVRSIPEKSITFDKLILALEGQKELFDVISDSAKS